MQISPKSKEIGLKYLKILKQKDSIRINMKKWWRKDWLISKRKMQG